MIWLAHDNSSLLAGTKAALVAPAPGSVLTGIGATFTWTAGVNAEAYRLWIGTTRGDSDVFKSVDEIYTSVLTHSISGLPEAGETLYVRLWTKLDGQWFYTEYELTAFGAATTAAAPPASLWAPLALR